MKALRIAAIVVSIAAAIPSGGTSLLAAGLATTAATASMVATGLSVGVGLLGAMTAKKPSVSGVQTSWSADPDAPIPILFGRTLASGDIRYRKQHGAKNAYDTLVSVLCGCGPVESIDQTYMEKKPIVFSGGGLYGHYTIGGQPRIWQDAQLGQCPESAQLSVGAGVPPGWDSTSKLSGYAATMLTLLYDAKGDDTLTSTPRFNWLGRWVRCYDPRLDSTYPGGSGACRIDDQATWVYSENGWIQALTFAIGWHQGPNNIRVGGVGLPADSIDIAAYVENANIADANGWKSGGRVTTQDDKWEVMKSLTQAGGGEPIRYGATLSGFVNSPRVSIATITFDDIIGAASITTAQTIRDRINGITPRYTSEDHFWEQVPAGTVQNTDYLAADSGRERTKMVSYPMVQCAAGETPDQVAQLAAYDIANAREAGPIVLPLKLRWLGYRGGDCLTIDDDPAFGWIRGKDVIVVTRQFDADSAAVVLTLRTETPAKHPWALSRIGVPAPMTDDTEPATLDAPDAADWSVAAGTSGVPSIMISGSVDAANVAAIDFAYRVDSTTDWVGMTSSPPDATAKEFAGLEPGESYEAGVRYRATAGASAWLALGPVTVGEVTATSADSATTAGDAAQLGGTYTAPDITDILDRLSAAGIP